MYIDWFPIAVLDERGLHPQSRGGYMGFVGYLFHDEFWLSIDGFVYQIWLTIQIRLTLHPHYKWIAPSSKMNENYSGPTSIATINIMMTSWTFGICYRKLNEIEMADNCTV